MASRHRKQSTKLNYYSLKVSHNCKSSLCHIIKFLVSLVILLYQKINDANWMTDQLSLIDNSVSAACSWSKILEGMGSAMSQKLHHLWILQFLLVRRQNVLRRIGSARGHIHFAQILKQTWVTFSVESPVASCAWSKLLQGARARERP